MPKGNQSLFAEDSESDSVNTTTTPEDDVSEKEYDVEKVLAETLGADGTTMYYLLKWEGYPLYDCTWEKKENITSEILLRHWENDKRAARQGQIVLFDVTEYEQAVEQHLEAQARKRRRRNAKRRKRGEILPSSDEDEEEYEEELPTTQAPARSRARVSPVKRKNMALPVAKTRAKVTRNVIDGIGQDEDSEIDSLFEEVERPAPVPPKQKESRPTPVATNATAPSGSITKLPSNPALVDQSKITAIVPKDATSISSARKTAPSTAPKSTATTKRNSGSNVFAGDWTQEKKRRQRVRVSGETPKDSTDPKYKLLSVQNRYQKYSQNEPAPDLSALTMLDPKTGRAVPTANAAKKAGPEDIHKAYGRRTPPVSEAGTPTESPKDVRQSNLGVRTEPKTVSNITAALPEPLKVNAVARPHGYDSRKSITCKYWLSGHCQYTAENCLYAHAYVNQKKQITCYYWYHGRKCRKTAEQCEFAHEDTGEYAGPPGSFRRKSMAADVPLSIKESDLQLMKQASPISDETVMPSVEPLLATPFQMSPSPYTGTFEAFAAGSEVANADGNKVADPRLRGRASFVNDAIQSSPKEIDVSVFPTQAPIKEVEMRDMEDGVDHGLGSPDVDLEMAKAGIRKLDASKLLSLHNNKAKEIEHVYVHMPNRPAEQDLLIKYFEGLSRKVYSSKAIGAWDYFRKTHGSCCVVVVHPLELFNGTLPGLHSILLHHFAEARIFSIGVQWEMCALEYREPIYEALVIFPYGRITFITDDVFSYYPEKATAIIESFLKGAETKAPGAEQNKIGARPGIKKWLEWLVLKKWEEQGYPTENVDQRWADCYVAVCRLCPIEDEDPFYTEHAVPSETSYLWSLWEESLPSFKGKWESGDEEGATDYMANLFAGEACCNLGKFRTWVFVYQRPGQDKVVTNAQGQQEVKALIDPKGWMQKYNHIGVVTPDQMLKSKRK